MILLQDFKSKFYLKQVFNVFLFFFQNIPFDPFVQKWHYLEICDCENNIIWLLTISIFFVLLLLAALYFALTTRKLFIYPMNDTWNCGICIYVILCFGIYCLLVGFLAADYPDLFFGLIAAGIIICVTAVLIILFLHKVRMYNPVLILIYYNL